MLLTLEHIDATIASTENHIKKLEDDLNALNDFLRLLKSQKTKICPHTNTFTKDAYDYHNGVEWVETYCADCGKYLSKE